MRTNFIDMVGNLDIFIMPKSIVDNDKLSIEAKMLYMLMYDRMRNSRENRGIDKNGDIYIHYTVDEIKRDLKVANKKAINLKKELIENKLLEEVRQGLGKPNKLYVLHF